MQLNQFEKKRKQLEINLKTEEIFNELEELLRIPQKLLVKVGEIEGLLGKPLDHARKKISNIERNINHIQDEILKKMEE